MSEHWPNKVVDFYHISITVFFIFKVYQRKATNCATND